MVQRWLEHQDSSLNGEGSSEAQGGKWHFGGRVNILVLPLFPDKSCVLLWLLNRFCLWYSCGCCGSGGRSCVYCDVANNFS